MLSTIRKAIGHRAHASADRQAEVDRLLHEVWLARDERDQIKLQLEAAQLRLARYEGAAPEGSPAARGLPVSPMDPLPASPDDPRLRGWYHAIDLGNGLEPVDPVYDLRPTAQLVGIPESLAGRTALDVGTASGFWAFEMERRGADRVVAADIVRVREYDLLPIQTARFNPNWRNHINHNAQHFATAHAMRKSRVEFRECSIYNLSPESVGEFDVVYCGALLVHLFNPLQALVRIRSVTRGMAVIETTALQDDDYEAVERHHPQRALLRFANADGERDELGKYSMFWYFSEKALVDMMTYAGFTRVETRPRFRTTGPGGNLAVTSVVGYP